MRPVITASEGRAADAAWGARTGLPSLLLMETAGRVLADVVRQVGAGSPGGIVVVAGPGNNGGDGWAAARWLHGWGLAVSVLPIAEAKAADAVRMRDAARRVGVPLAETLDGAAVLVDAMVGTGLARPLDRVAAAFAGELNRSPAIVVSADLPSGVHADTGAVGAVAVRADHTVTFGALKRGLLLGEGVALAGAITVADLGLDLAQVSTQVVEAGDVAAHWPRRSLTGPKSRSGHLLVVAGSAAMAGAAVLTCLGALAAGVGLITLVAPRGAWARLAALPPEVMLVPGGEGDLWDGSLPPLERFSAVAAGPGLAGGAALTDAGVRSLRRLYTEVLQPCVFDADALVTAGGAPSGPRVVTPHPGEAARMLGSSVTAVQADRVGSAEALARGGAVALLKGHHTLVAAPRGGVSFNPTGGPALATAGSGDVLTGLVGALLARGLSAVDAARAAAFVHGAAGDRCGRAGGHGVTASAVAAAVPAVLVDLVGSANGLPGA